MNKEEWEKAETHIENAKKHIEGRFITVHWWNMGHKTLDYSGTYGGLMKEKGIKSRLLHGQVGFRFTIELASSRTVWATAELLKMKAQEIKCPVDSKPCDREFKTCCSCERNNK